MPTGVLHLKEVDTDEITLDGTLSVSGASTLEGATVANSTLSVGGAATLADASATNVNVSGTLSVAGKTTMGGDIIPDTNDAYDIGSPEFKIRDLYVSNNSIWVGDDMKISNEGGKLKFRKRKTNVVPQAILDAGANAGHANEQATADAALAHAGVGHLSQMKLQHWFKFMRTMNQVAKITDIFRDNNDDYEESSASDAWKEIPETNKIYTNSLVGVGTSDPDDTLHVKGSLKVESETGFKLIRTSVGGTDPTVVIDTHNFGTDETVNDLTGRGDSKYTKLYRVYGRNSEGVGRSWYWGYANDDYANISLAFDGGGIPDPDIAFTFTTASELYCNKVFAALGGNADTATLAAEATKLATPRKINGVDFDGTQDITLSTEATKLATPVNINGVAFDGSSDIQVTTINTDAATGNPFTKMTGGAPTDTYSFLLNGPRPGTLSGGAVHFINGEGRSDDGGVSTYTIRNDSGNLRLGRAGSTTKIEGNVEFVNNPTGVSNDLIEAAGGDYGSINVTSNRNNWGGYSIFNQWNFMARTNDISCGIFDDGKNKWSINCVRESYTYLYFNGDWKMRTESYGVRINSDLYVDRVGFGTDIGYRIEKSGGDYMTVTTQGSKNEWGGYNIQNQWGLMAHTNGAECGIFNDQDNQWGMICGRNSHTYLHWSGDWKMRTEDWGVRIAGRLHLDGYGWIDDKINARLAPDASTQRITASDFGWRYGGNGHTSHANYGGNGDWYIRSNSSSGSVNIQDTGGITYIKGVLYSGNNHFTGANGAIQIWQQSSGYSCDAISCRAHHETNHIINFLNSSGTLKGRIQGQNAGSIVIHYSSDERMKKDVQPMGSSLERVRNLNPCTYKWISDGKDDYGFIAQEVFRVFPEMRSDITSQMAKPCCEDEYEYPLNKDGTDYIHGLDYGKFTPYLTKAIQELDDKVEETNCRKSFISDIGYSEIKDHEGLIVSASTNEYKNGKPTLKLSDVERDKKCYGIILGKNTRSVDSDTDVQRHGDGKMWVINTAGNLESGDLITTANIKGYGTKQDDDLMRSYTVAKLTQDCDFTPKNVPVKRKKQEVREVTYYVQDYWIEITEFIKYKKEDLVERTVTKYLKYCDDSENDPSEHYTEIITPEISQKDYDELSEEERKNYKVQKVLKKNCYEYDHLEDKTNYIKISETGYYLNEQRESTRLMPECCGAYESKTRKELVDVLDENGQIQWEDSNDREESYEIRYLDANGVVTDKEHAVHIAALVGCTFHCG